MFVEERPFAVIQPQPFPHAITQHEPAVIDANDGLIAGHNFTVHIDKDRLIADVVVGLVCCHVIGHGGPLFATLGPVIKCSKQ